MIDDKEAAKVLREAAALISQPGAWTTGTYARNKEGVQVQPDSPDAVCWCALGAIRKCAPDDDIQMRAVRMCLDTLGYPMYMFNDRQDSAQSVVDILKLSAWKLDGNEA